MKLEEKLLEQYVDVIEKNGNTENQIQEFLEENTIFIPMPFLLNHYLHMNCVISKFKLGNEFVTDFAYLTKSSDYWEFVLVELEDAKKKIFTNDKENIYFHSEFNHAYDQITSWNLASYGRYDDGTEFPKGYRQVYRFLNGSFVIFSKQSVYH